MKTDIPANVRREVLLRDGQCCRVCGRWADAPALHHILFRSHGGLHIPSNLVVVGFTPGHECHLRFAHGPRAQAFASALTVVVDHPGLTAIQLLRWAERRTA